MPSIVRETDTLIAAYAVQATCQVQCQSRVSVRVRSVRAASSNNANNMNKSAWEGNNYKIDAHTINMCSKRTSNTTHRSALIPLKGFVAGISKKIYVANTETYPGSIY